MTAAPITATCPATFPLNGAPAAPCDRQPHATGLHTAEVAGVGFVWSDRDMTPLPDWERMLRDTARAVYGDDIPAPAAGRIEAVGCAMLTLRAHEWLPGLPSEPTSPTCACGWFGLDHARHVAEQLYATGALDPSAPAVAAVIDRVADLAHRLHGRPSAIREINAVIAAHDALTGGGA